MTEYKNKSEYVDSMENKAMNFLKFIGFGIIVIIMVLVFSFAIKFLWNALMPGIFGLPEITYWQGVGLMILTKMFFGGFSSNSNTSSGSKKSNKTVNGEIGQAIRSEIRKEMEAEYKSKYGNGCNEYSTDEDFDPTPSETSSGLNQDTLNANMEQEALYDAWWDKEGEQLFETYLNERLNSQ